MELAGHLSILYDPDPVAQSRFDFVPSTILESRSLARTSKPSNEASMAIPPVPQKGSTIMEGESLEKESETIKRASLGSNVTGLKNGRSVGEVPL